MAVIQIDRSNPFDPVPFSCEGAIIVGQYETLALEVDMSQVTLETMLRPGETGISGREWINRLRSSGKTPLDALIFKTLWNDWRLIPKEWKSKGLILFDGTEIGGEIDEHTLSMYWDKDSICWRMSLVPVACLREGEDLSVCLGG